MRRFILWLIIFIIIVPFKSEGSFRNLRKNFLKKERSHGSLNKKFSSPLSLLERKNFKKHYQFKANCLLEEFLLDTTRILGPSPHDQEFSSIAFDGTNYFVVWHDWRNDGDIYGARITPQGILLDTFGIPICTTYDWQIYPTVAFDGNNYLVVWEDWRNWEGDIYGARVTPQGIVLDPEGFPISTAFYDQQLPSISFDGTNYLVTWNDYRNNIEEPDIYAARVTTNGTVLDPDGIAISTAPFYQMIFRGIAFDGRNYFLTWMDDRDGDWYFDIYGARLTTNGILIDTNGIQISTAENNQYLPQISFDGTNYFIVWYDDREMEEDFRIYGARVTTTGIVLDPQGIQISQYFSLLPSIKFDGTNYLVVWSEYRSGWEFDIYGSRITPAGIVLDPEGIPISTYEFDQELPSISFDGNNYFITWSDYRNEDSDIYGARVTTSGTVLDPDGILLNYGYYSPTQLFPKVAFDGVNYFVVWEDYRNGKGDIYGTRVSPDGRILDPEGIIISNAEDYQTSPAVAFDGTNYLVVWADWRNGEGDIYGARVTPEGIVLDPNGISISTAEINQVAPSLAFDGINYLVVWRDFRNYESDIYGARVSRQGTVLDPEGIPICTAIYDQYGPNVSFDGTNYLVVWDDGRDGEDSNIYGARVTRTGIVLDPQGIPISTAEYEQWYPEVAFDGNNYLVVWWDDRDGDWYFDIYGARLTPNGNVLEPQGIPISTADFDQYEPSLTFDGTNYFVIWTDGRAVWDSDIYGARVTPQGIVLDPNGIELINQEESRYSPHLTKGPLNQLLLTFSGYVPLFGVTKTFGAFYPGPSPEIKENITKKFGFKIYPLFVKNSLLLEFFLEKEDNIKLELIDITGKIVKSIINKYQPGSHRIKFPTQNISSGIYFLKVITNKKNFITKITILK
ncbi:MAG: T9SS type A sorting domain-containing protein [candidate division WOR-3 bacterium]|nr:T9SS type A sorting domain-containing protein [candidate division WOR-3 bacterium]